VTGENLIFFNCPHFISVNVHVHVFVAHNRGAMWNYDRSVLAIGTPEHGWRF
jgi:hypothetical protein